MSVSIINSIIPAYVLPRVGIDAPQCYIFDDASDLNLLTSTAVLYYDYINIVRKILRDNSYCIDITMTITGFDGVENVDWKNLLQYTGETSSYRYGFRDNKFVVDCVKKIAATDWFLPSQMELHQMKEVLHDFGVGGFSNTKYWSSTEHLTDSDLAYYMDFDTGTETFQLKATSSVSRACRTFISSETYLLRDIGPSGGLIFHIIDNGDGTYTYYEADTTDQIAKPYSNITDALAGASDDSIGAGQANTTAVINQIGHTDSAAKLSDENESGLIDSENGFSGVEGTDWENIYSLSHPSGDNVFRDCVRDEAYRISEQISGIWTELEVHNL